MANRGAADKEVRGRHLKAASHHRQHLMREAAFGATSCCLELPKKATSLNLLREEAVRLLLTYNLADRHRITECSGLAAASGVYGDHAYMQQVPGCQILDAVAVTLCQFLVSSDPVCCWRNKRGVVL